MLEPGYHLRTELDFKKAKLSRKPVMVKYEDGEIADYGGSIEIITSTSIKINGIYYVKSVCLFYIR